MALRDPRARHSAVRTQQLENKTEFKSHTEGSDYDNDG